MTLFALCVLAAAGALRVAVSVSFSFTMALRPWDQALFLAAIPAGWLLFLGLRNRGDTAADRTYLVNCLLRAELATMMMIYGFSKVVLQQFSQSFSELDSRILTTTGVVKAWSFFGHSGAYQAFLGLSECLGALLLLHYHTLPAGAGLLSIVLTNIVFVNFTHDIGVRANSSLYLAQALALLWPEQSRILAFLRGQAVEARSEPAIRRKLKSRVESCRLVLVSGIICYLSYNQWMHAKHKPAPHPLVGIWQSTSASPVQRIRFDNDHSGSLSRINHDEVWFRYEYQPGLSLLKMEEQVNQQWSPSFQGKALLHGADELELIPAMSSPVVRYQRVQL